MDSKHNALLLLTNSMFLCEEEQEILRNDLLRTSQNSKRPSIRRLRSNVSVATQCLADKQFRRAFRMKREIFMSLVCDLQYRLQRNELQGRLSSGDVVRPDVRLAITLRLLAGGTYHDQMMTWNVGRSSTVDVFLDTLSAVREEISTPGIPFSDIPALKLLANGFLYSRNVPSPLYG